VDGQPCGGRLQGEVRRYDFTSALQYFLCFPVSVEVPLAVGSRVIAFRRVGGRTIELHCTSGEGEEEGSEGLSDADAHSELQEAEVGQGPAADAQQAESAEQQQNVEGGGQAQQQRPQQQQQQEAAAAPQAYPAVSAALQALNLAQLQISATCSDVVLQEAASTAFAEVQRVGDALGLPLLAIDEACGGVDAATQEPVSCRRFLRMNYCRLVMTCAGGDVSVVRRWMEGMAARGRV